MSGQPLFSTSTLVEVLVFLKREDKINVAEFAGKVGVHRRTVYKYLHSALRTNKKPLGIQRATKARMTSVFAGILRSDAELVELGLERYPSNPLFSQAKFLYHSLLNTVKYDICELRHLDAKVPRDFRKFFLDAEKAIAFQNEEGIKTTVLYGLGLYGEGSFKNLIESLQARYLGKLAMLCRRYPLASMQDKSLAFIQEAWGIIQSHPEYPMLRIAVLTTYSFYLLDAERYEEAFNLTELLLQENPNSSGGLGNQLAAVCNIKDMDQKVRMRYCARIYAVMYPLLLPSSEEWTEKEKNNVLQVLQSKEVQLVFNAHRIAEVVVRKLGGLA